MLWIEWTYHYQIVKLDIMRGRVESTKFGQLLILAKIDILFLKKRNQNFTTPYPIPIQSLLFDINIKLCIIFTKGGSAQLLDALKV